MNFAVQRLNEGIRAALIAHFLTLPLKDRALRFGAAIAPAVIAAYVGGIDFGRDALFGIQDDALALVGVAHVALVDNVGEVALSVLPPQRRHGMAAAMFKRAVTHARSRCIPRLFMYFLSGNAPIMRMANRFGMDIVSGYGNAVAHLELQAASTIPVAAERIRPVECRPVGSAPRVR